MNRRHTRSSRKVGAAPGTLVHVGPPATHTVKVTVIDYDAGDHFREWEPRDLNEIAALKDSPTVSWVNVDGIHDVDVVAQLGRLFGIHSLILEDILHPAQRPRVEDLGESLYVVLKMLSPGATAGEVEWEQLSIIVSRNTVLTFQEKPGGDFLDPVRRRIREDRGRIRKMGTDYLAHALLDLVVDNYFLVLEPLGDQIEILEDLVVTDPVPKQLQEINRLRRSANELRRSVWPLREVLSILTRSESPLIQAGTRPYFRDVYDHTIQIIDTVEVLREMLGGMVEIYMSSLSNRMNQVMKVLTAIATVFIPLTFLVGVYGMNFDNMPELRWRYGYAAVWLVMLCSAGGMLYYFKRKGWY